MSRSGNVPDLVRRQELGAPNPTRTIEGQTSTSCDLHQRIFLTIDRDDVGLLADPPPQVAQREAAPGRLLYSNLSAFPRLHLTDARARRTDDMGLSTAFDRFSFALRRRMIRKTSSILKGLADAATSKPKARASSEMNNAGHHAPYFGHPRFSPLPLARSVMRNTSKITAVDQPNSSTPFIAVIGPSKCQRTTGVTSP